MEKEKNIMMIGKLLFEGEYLNGKRWNRKGYNKVYKIGKEKEYYFNGKLEFEGE